MKKGTAVLREKNKKMVLSILRKQLANTRFDIAKQMKVSKNTISLIIDEYIKNNIVEETGVNINGNVGRPKRKIQIKNDALKTIGVSISKNKVSIVVTDYALNVLEEKNFSLDTNNIEECFKKINHTCNSILSVHPQVIGVGVSLPGIVDPNEGFLYYSSHLDWKSVPVRERISQSVPVKVTVLNKVKAISLMYVEENKADFDSFFYIRIREGVGGAHIDKKQINYGYSWTAGEIGHICVDNEGPVCGCGQTGCLETLVNTSIITEKIREIEAIRDRDIEKLKNELFVKAGSSLGVAISTVIHLCNPEYILVDSPYERFTTFKESALKVAYKRSLKFPFDHTKIVFNNNNYSAEMGAAVSVILNYENV